MDTLFEVGRTPTPLKPPAAPLSRQSPPDDGRNGAPDGGSAFSRSYEARERAEAARRQSAEDRRLREDRERSDAAQRRRDRDSGAPDHAADRVSERASGRNADRSADNAPDRGSAGAAERKSERMSERAAGRENDNGADDRAGDAGGARMKADRNAAGASGSAETKDGAREAGAPVRDGDAPGEGFPGHSAATETALKATPADNRGRAGDIAGYPGRAPGLAPDAGAAPGGSALAVEAGAETALAGGRTTPGASEKTAAPEAVAGEINAAPAKAALLDVRKGAVTFSSVAGAKPASARQGAPASGMLAPGMSAHGVSAQGAAASSPAVFDPQAALLLEGGAGMEPASELRLELADRVETRRADATMLKPGAGLHNRIAVAGAQPPLAQQAADVMIDAASGADAGADLGASKQALSGSVSPASFAAAASQAAPSQAVSAPAASQLVAAVKSERIGNGNTIEVRLDPPEMGRVRIDFSLETADAVKAVLTVERPETLEHLRRHAHDLMDQLKQAGFAEIDLEFSNDGSAGFGDGDGAAFMETEDEALAPQRDVVYLSLRDDARVDLVV